MSQARGSQQQRTTLAFYFHSIHPYKLGPWVLYLSWLRVLGEIIFPCIAVVFGVTVCCFQNQSWADILLRCVYLETSVLSSHSEVESSQSRPDTRARSQLPGGRQGDWGEHRGGGEGGTKRERDQSREEEGAAG